MDSEELTKTATYLRKEFEMKNLEKIKFCLGLNIEHFREGIFLQKNLHQKNLKAFLYW